ncbi:MAG: type IX secretion system membrane protein PorP/SprF [Flavobacteriales bacterium]|nr:type IX secretion system membrane protein PorP/SprF [Flavobacteriales bacterium]MCB9166460.1 type IX secretion system membrane protein PorP/SprF [Flavobacteriales bacterium]
MRYPRYILPLLCAVLTGPLWAQHTPLTSQYLFNGLLIDPAYAGSRDALTVNLTYRDQWTGFDGAPSTAMLSIHTPVKRTRMGLGAIIYNDRLGVSNETGLLLNYAYRLPLGKGKLSMGLGGGVNALQARWSEVELQRSDDAAFASDTRMAVRPNFSAGVYYYSKVYFIGASLPFFLTRKFDAERNTYVVENDTRQYQPMLTGGYVFKLDHDLKLKPTGLIRYQMSSSIQADLGLHLIVKERFWAGVSYRTGDAVVGMFEVLPTPQWRVGYSYDLGLSAISPYHGGTHELMVQYEMGYRIRVRDPRYF